MAETRDENEADDNATEMEENYCKNLNGIEKEKHRNPTDITSGRQEDPFKIHLILIIKNRKISWVN